MKLAETASMIDPLQKAPPPAGNMRWWLLAVGIAVALFIALAILPHFFSEGPSAQATLPETGVMAQRLIRLLHPLAALLKELLREAVGIVVQHGF
jgi:hypothetical protein